MNALRGRGLEPSGLILGSWPAEPDLAERCNLEDLPRVSRVPLLAMIPEGAGAMTREAFIDAAPGWFDQTVVQFSSLGIPRRRQLHRAYPSHPSL